MAASLFKWLFLPFLLFPNNNNGKLLSVNVAPHPLYVTVSEFNHNAKDKDIEISCKIFTNDFETTLKNTYHVEVDLSDPKDKKGSDKLVSDYIQNHLHLKVDGKPVALEFVGSEKETDATWSYFQVSNIVSVKKIEITNTLLYDSFDGEINIMHVSVAGNRQSQKLDKPDSYVVFQF